MFDQDPKAIFAYSFNLTSSYMISNNQLFSINYLSFLIFCFRDPLTLWNYVIACYVVLTYCLNVHSGDCIDHKTGAKGRCVVGAITNYTNQLLDYGSDTESKCKS